MLLSTQLWLLNSLIGDEGDCIGAFIEDRSLNLGTKVLYLQRAINEDCQTFLASLDKLFDYTLENEARDANIELIRILKLINDLCFNNEIKFGIYGLKNAAMHYFSHLGAVDLESIRTTIQIQINQHISKITEGRVEQVNTEIQARLLAESNILRESAWRVSQDLPDTQLEPPFPIDLSRHLTRRHYLLLSSRTRTVVAENPFAARRLMGLFQQNNLTFHNFTRMNADVIQDLCACQSTYHDTLELTLKRGITLTDLSLFTRETRRHLLKNYYNVVFVMEVLRSFTFSPLLEYSEEIRAELVKYPREIARLVMRGVSLVDLFTLQTAQRDIFYKHSIHIANQLESGTTSFAQLASLDASELETVLINSQTEEEQHTLRHSSRRFR